MMVLPKKQWSGVVNVTGRGGAADRPTEVRPNSVMTRLRCFTSWGIRRRKEQRDVLDPSLKCSKDGKFYDEKITKI